MGQARIVVIGGGYAGILAAQRLARRGAGRVILISAQDELVHRIRLHELAAGAPRRRLPLAGFLAGTGAELRVARVERVDAGRRELQLAGGERLPADVVLLATGSQTDRRLPGSEHVHSLDGHERTLAFAAALARGGRLLVVGGGATALEAVTELAERRRDLRVQLVTPEILPGLSPAAQAHARAVLARLGVELIAARVQGFEPGAALTTSGRLAFDHALLAGGFVPSPLAGESGLPVDERGRLPVDATMMATPWLYAAGDVAVPHESVGAPMAMSCKCALPMAAAAADAMAARLAGREARPLSWGDTGMCISLGRGDGLIQHRARDGRDTGMWRGRPAVWSKELVARYVLFALRLSRRIDSGYVWLAGPRVTPPKRLTAGSAPPAGPAPARPGS